MNNLYSELAAVYEAMYQTFIDYKEEYHFYSEILKKHKKKEVAEIGCGTGNLANYFMEAGFDYLGLDLSDNMISLAKAKAPTARFMKTDMRNFQLSNSVESTIITARTISYLLTNEDLNNAFSSIATNLEKGGLLVFDIIDANRFISMVAGQQEIIHTAIHNQTTYVRKSLWSLELVNGMDFHWNAGYYKKDEENLIKIGQDDSKVRTFMLNEIEIFLMLNGFKIKEVIDRPSYFFPTYVFVAEKA